MDVPYSLDAVARTTEEEAVRRHFAQRNLMWLWVLLFVFSFFSLIAFGISAQHGNTANVMVALANAVLIFVVIMLRRRAKVWVQKRATALLITFLALQYGLILTFFREGPNWMPWVMIFPYLVILCRMAVAELLLVHAIFTAGAFMMPLLLGATAGPGDDALGISFGAAANNALALGVELIFSYRRRKQITRDWRERRTQAQEQIRMRDELRYARELQLSMLPECAPDLEWADLCAISIPATEVGGDYYDYFVDQDRVALVCGDVAGHGMASGLVLSALRSGFTLLRDSLVDPAAVLRRLHDLVAQTSRRRMLVTVTVVLLDRTNSRATIASAGHPPVILRRANGTVETIDLFAPPLGVRLPVSIPQRQIDIAAGDVFVLHSDGIYETRNDADEVYGLDRLAAIVQSNDGSAESIRDAILADVDRFRGSVLQGDDVTVVVARIV